MRITHVKIENYRNIKSVDVDLGNTVVIAGENNSGKSNFLRAITLPFLAEEGGYSGKTLTWTDINAGARDAYYSFLLANKESILSGKLGVDEFSKSLPSVCVEVQILPEAKEKYYVKDISSSISGTDIEYRIRYEFKPKKVLEILTLVKDVLTSENIDENSINNVQLSLLPIDLYEYSIFVPGKGSVSYDTLKQFRYLLLAAERDEFSTTNDRIGSKALIKLLQMKLNDADKLKVEKKYSEFFDILKNLSGMESVINWQSTSNIENAEAFFRRISILPNMPPMSSVLNSVRLGYDDESLSMQGLGQRNMILLLVLINSLLERTEEVPLRIVAIEEPEAHLCINNIKLISSFLKAFSADNQQVQTFCTTHSTEFINKLAFDNVILMNNGNGIALRDELNQTAREYLSKNPNLDLYKLFFARRCILVEGLTEELLIRAYIESKKELSEIEVLAFHKGYQDIIKIWKKINKGTDRRLGIVRDYDNQENAKRVHEELADGQVCIKTTTGYTLETDIVNAGNNYSILMNTYGSSMGWENMTADQMQNDWRESKSYVMLQLCQDLRTGKLESFTMPPHIQEVISFMESEVTCDED